MWVRHQRRATPPAWPCLRSRSAKPSHGHHLTVGGGGSDPATSTGAAETQMATRSLLCRALLFPPPRKTMAARLCEGPNRLGCSGFLSRARADGRHDASGSSPCPVCMLYYRAHLTCSHRAASRPAAPRTIDHGVVPRVRHRASTLPLALVIALVANDCRGTCNERKPHRGAAKEAVCDAEAVMRTASHLLPTTATLTRGGLPEGIDGTPRGTWPRSTGARRR